MFTYTNYRGDVIATDSKARKSIEAGNMDNIRVPWFKFSKLEPRLYGLEVYDGEAIHTVAMSDVPSKLLIVMRRHFYSVSKGKDLSDADMNNIKKLLDKME